MGFLNQIFERRKFVALVTGATVVAGLEFSRIYVPDCVENKFKYRLKFLVNHSVMRLARLCSLLKIDSEPALIRKMVKKVSLFLKANPYDYPNVKVCLNI
jgi:hypothetical protein